MTALHPANKPIIKKQLVLLFLCAVMTTAYCQGLDSKGKKQGKYKRYLDKYWKVLDDSSNAVYFRYTYYDHGLDVRPFGQGGANKLWKMKTVVDTAAQKGIKILDGDYRWHDPKGRLMYWHVLKNGDYLLYKEFYETGELSALYDYSKHAEGQELSFHLTTYDKKGNVTSEGYIKKDKKGKWSTLDPDCEETQVKSYKE
jgi:hypothetical protein